MSTSDRSGRGAALPEMTGLSSSQLERVARYRVERRLGSGCSDEAIYVARDEQLGRRVIVHIPPVELVGTAEAKQAYLDEARAVASLDHPHIVPIFDVGSSDEVPCYVVAKFIDGEPLSVRFRRDTLDCAAAAGLVAAVATALHHAHQQGFVHGAVNPRNILLDTDGQAHLAHFEVLRKLGDWKELPESIDITAYLSPEQARCEGHRVDASTDLFSLGVVLYELLTGRCPFAATTQAELVQRIVSHEPQSPARHDQSLPRELQRICLRALEKRAADRPSAEEFAAELEGFLSERKVQDGGSSESASSSQQQTVPMTSLSTAPHTPGAEEPGPDSSTHIESVKIVPKGLKSFDGEDSSFFLELLPGARDRQGLPDSIRFWKTRIEESDPDRTFAVAVIYGPSGCGKSSLVKAGLLPRLSDNITSIYIEATPHETERKLLNRLRQRLPKIDQQLNLPHSMSTLRQGRGLPANTKILIVIDQFEQWMHSHREEEGTLLAEALRQCDGSRLQCLLLVRDDFWMAATRFMRQLDIRIVEAENAAAVDLFSTRHARRVLAAFGRAFGTLPGASTALTADQSSFLDRAVAGLAENDRVFPVRLAMFAEMMKHKPWDGATLANIGGARGVGLAFLVEAFDASTAPLEHRLHERAARAVLAELLPESAADIKGHKRSREELLQASGYAERPRDFADLLQILDNGLRLISPSDDHQEGTERAATNAEEPTNAVPGSSQYYQLTHDYLVQPLRDWLTRNQQETLRGRAELRLAERTDIWHRRGDDRLLVSSWEYANIRLFTDKRKWTPKQRLMMRRAAGTLGVRWCSVLMVATVVFFGVYSFLSATAKKQRIDRARNSVRGVLTVPADEVHDALTFVRPLQEDTLPMLQEAFMEGSTKHAQLRSAIALAHFGQVEIQFVVDAIRDADPAERRNIMSVLMKKPEAAIAALQRQADSLGNWAAARAEDEAVARLVKAIDAAKDLPDRPGPDWQEFAAPLRSEVKRLEDERRKLAAKERAHWDYKARLAVSLLQLGESSVAREMCRISTSNVQRTAFINSFELWPCDLQVLFSEVSDDARPDWRSAVCLAAGTVQASDEVKAAWRPQLVKWYFATDSLTRSAADWHWRRWNLGKMPAAPPQRSRKAMWHLTPVTRLTMIRLPAGKVLGGWHRYITIPLRIHESFCLSDREITVGLFRQFMEDVEYGGLKPIAWTGPYSFASPTDLHPVQQVSWYDAVLFCNWLSWKEGRKPYYKVTNSVEGNASPDAEYVVNRDDDSDGFRLPTARQWDYACRAGATTPYSFGVDNVDAGWFGIFSINSNMKTGQVGDRMCNPWGFFDMHGNVWEWCWDSKPSVRRLAGGSYLDGIRMSRASAGSPGWPPSRRNLHGGFRVASPVVDRSL